MDMEIKHEHPFTLKQHYCHIEFVNTQHNFEITYLHFNNAGCPVGVLERSNHLRTKISYLFMSDNN